MNARDTVMTIDEIKSYLVLTGQMEIIKGNNLEQLDRLLQASISAQAGISFRAAAKEFGFQLRARIGGIDELIDWSDEGLRQFRKMTLSAIRDILKEWSIG